MVLKNGDADLVEGERCVGDESALEKVSTGSKSRGRDRDVGGRWLRR